MSLKSRITLKRVHLACVHATHSIRDSDGTHDLNTVKNHFLGLGIAILKLPIWESEKKHNFLGSKLIPVWRSDVRVETLYYWIFVPRFKIPSLLKYFLPGVPFLWHSRIYLIYQQRGISSHTILVPLPTQIILYCISLYFPHSTNTFHYYIYF